jgi:hemolysin D
METPPSPAGRAIGLAILLLFGVALCWSAVGKVDVVATSPGKIIVRGRTKVVQPAESGVVRAIHVHDGSRVKAGDVLIELDPTISAAELGHVKSDLLAARFEVARLDAALASPSRPESAFRPPPGASDQMIEMHREVLVSQAAEQTARISEVDRQLLQKGAERETIAATIAKLVATIPLLQERVDVRKYLYDKAVGSKLVYLTEAQELVGQQHDVLVQQSKLREVEAAIGELTEVRRKVEAEYRHKLYEDLAKARQRAEGLAQDAEKAEQKATQQRLISPVDGVVQQLAVHTIGGVVTPAQAVAAVVSLEPNLEIEAMVSNRDIGFIAVGQEAEIKVDTFNFTRYGLLRGQVVSISRDAIARSKSEEGPRQAAAGAESVSSEPRGQELVYAARVNLDQREMQIEGRPVELLPGMAVTVEIKTGSRRIISYLLSPLMRYHQEVLRER